MNWLCNLLCGRSSSARLDEIIRRLIHLEQQGDQIMATLEEYQALSAQLQVKLTELGEAVTAERAEVQAGLAALTTQIQSLQAQLDALNAGQLVSQAQLDALAASADAALASADALVARVRDISEPIV